MSLEHKLSVMLLVACIATTTYAQDESIKLKDQIALPFLLIAPDARSTSVGETGVSTSVDSYSMHWNAAKYAFQEENSLGISITPWKRHLIDDMNLFYLSGSLKVSNLEYLAASFKYFTMGRTYFSDAQGNETNSYKPADLSVDFAYIRKLSQVLSLSTTVKYIRSDITTLDFVQSQGVVGHTVAADIGLFYKRPIALFKGNSMLLLGSSISNLGPKIRYGSLQQSIAAIIRIGSSLFIPISDVTQMTGSFELNKILHKNSQQHPGISAGVNFEFANIFSVGSGYYSTHEIPEEGNYFTSGLGVRYRNIKLSSSYLFPMHDLSALNDTFRLSLEYGFGSAK